ncbi:hypothetical protein WR25_12706 [Diploscapter pachys]|uniref:ADAMTS cysteine-rich domain-containing protein n=1 Tax=Diploscapter pachys TaxID=2018661 RepID=A0A2A2LLU5_9BILA|nr:hypothetical protein WR25_12706 [Diploscapter pachys]
MQLKFASLIALTLIGSGNCAGTWSTWGATSSTCGSCPAGTVKWGRTRTCILDAPGATCAGDRIEWTQCMSTTTTPPQTTTTKPPTTANGCDQWGQWGAYGACSKDCGNCGRRTRTRTCDSLATCPSVPCTGSATDTDPTICGGNDVCKAEGGYVQPNCCAGNKTLDRVARTYKCTM